MVLVLGFAAAACGGASTATTAGTSPIPTATATFASPTASAGTTAAPTPSASAAPGFVLVAFGDSIPAGMNCPDGCTGYVELYGPAVSKAIGSPVEVRNLARTDSLTSKRLFERLADPTYVQAATDADLLVLQIGFNDFQGPCTWVNHAMCLQDGHTQVATYLQWTLSAIAKLRGDRPLPMRVLTYYDNYVGFPEMTASAWGFEPTDANIAAFTKDYRAALRSFNAMVCDEAKAAGAICVDLLPAFNGPDGDQPATGLISNDGIHPSTAGHQRIAEALIAAGFADLGVK